MNAIHEKCTDGKLVCRAEQPLPEEVTLTISDSLSPGRWMVDFYENSSKEDAVLCRIRLGNLPKDAIVMGSKSGIIVALPAPQY